MNLGTKNRGGKHQFDKTKPSIFKNIGALRVIRGSLSSICEDPCSSVANKQKNHARKNAWPTLAPCGGITRIRFKGSSENVSDLSARRLPRTLVAVRIRPTSAKSITVGAAVSVVELQKSQATRLSLQNEDVGSALDKREHFAFLLR